MFVQFLSDMKYKIRQEKQINQAFYFYYYYYHYKLYFYPKWFFLILYFPLEVGYVICFLFMN